MVQSTAPNNRELHWTTAATATILVHPQPDAPINVMTDASDIAIGAVLRQHLDGQW